MWRRVGSQRACQHVEALLVLSKKEVCTRCCSAAVEYYVVMPTLVSYSN